MISRFSFARSTAIAALALGAGALLIPEPVLAQGRSGFSGGGRAMGVSGGGRSMGFAGGRGMVMARPMAAPRMAYGAGGRVYAPRAVAPRVYGARNLAYAGQYRTAGVNTQYGLHRPPYYNHRRPYYGRWRGGGYYPYWGWGLGAGLGLATAAYYANDGYYAGDCWIERRWVRTNYGRQLTNVRVCYAY